MVSLEAIYRCVISYNCDNFQKIANKYVRKIASWVLIIADHIHCLIYFYYFFIISKVLVSIHSKEFDIKILFPGLNFHR